MDNLSNNLVTILTVSHAYELAVIRARLEAEGIECFVQDELTAQVNSFFSGAIGGVKLQVRKSNFEDAIAILKDGGYMNTSELPQPEILNKLETFTSEIPGLNKLPFLFRLIILILITEALIFSVAFYTNLLSTFEKLNGY